MKLDIVHFYFIIICYLTWKIVALTKARNMCYLARKPVFWPHGHPVDSHPSIVYIHPEIFQVLSTQIIMTSDTKIILQITSDRTLFICFVFFFCCSSTTQTFGQKWWSVLRWLHYNGNKILSIHNKSEIKL